jgi:thymidylate kinase
VKGKLVIVDGPDGAGKSLIMDALAGWAEGRRVLDIRRFARDHGRLPSAQEFADYDVILSCEPTLAGIGKTIKEELIRGGKKYSPLSIAHAFAIDREILYRTVIVPALDSGKLVFQERGVLTSFVYQPVQIHIGLSELMNLPGNRLALKYAPSFVIICFVEPEKLLSRLGTESQIFEELSFLRKVDQRYKSEWLQAMFSKLGTKFVFLDTSGTEADTKEKALKLWQAFIGFA